MSGDGQEPLLSVRDLKVFYGAAAALRGISFDVYRGEIVAIIGGNGAGKSTTLRAVSGVSEVHKTVQGTVTFAGRRIEQRPAHKIAAMGMAHVPEGRRVFSTSTVEENLVLGGYRRRRNRSELAADIDAIYQRFPVLGQRRDQPAGLLSGGEQQMLAIGRGLMAQPCFLLLDEPSLGLAAPLVAEVFEIIKQLAAEGTTILLVEQLALQALAVADRAYVLETGTITAEGTAGHLAADPAVRAAYLGD
ncbi:MAG: branched-chain amino acid transport system ATP-binding protein [Acidimicrobiaceae bacterium]|nr:branched-chain amino acid transport system ATP-binding protein [Acidimicrobiaceae bacterium]